MMEEDRPDLGPCCCCGESGPDVRNIVMLHFKIPMSGRGWGCIVCGLPADGALYVCCDECFEKKANPKYACKGYPAKDGRLPIEELTEPFEHDEKLHRLYETQGRAI